MYLSIDEMDFETPEWIRAWVEANDGGWAFPFLVTADHPLVTEGHTCFDCGDTFQEDDVGIVMPFHDTDGGRWTMTHRECTVGRMFPEPAERARFRPPKYAEFPPERQWAVDKRLGILDWDGS